ncbi:RNA polymerase sigma-70 factor [Wenyingzhuangia sp. 1_MG-2023]|nr:RNA polymerase sigma-70 factor [Wenyingzhuangia sp. 1_MG-2023]
MPTKKDIKIIFDTYYETLVQYANRFLPLKDECEDLVQDVFVDLWQKENTFLDEISLKSYLYKATRNKCYNVIKHNTVKDKYTSETLQLLADDDVFFEHILEEEMTRQLYQAIEVLPSRKKEIIKLTLKGLKNNEIAENLNIKLQTVKTLKSQSYKILREQFKELNVLVNLSIA